MRRHASRTGPLIRLGPAAPQRPARPRRAADTHVMSGGVTLQQAPPDGGCRSSDKRLWCPAHTTVPLSAQVTASFCRGRVADIPVAAALPMSPGWSEGGRNGRDGRRGRGRGRGLGARSAVCASAEAAAPAAVSAAAASGRGRRWGRGRDRQLIPGTYSKSAVFAREPRVAQLLSSPGWWSPMLRASSIDRAQHPPAAGWQHSRTVAGERRR